MADQSELNAAFAITDDDLAANQRGYLSESQKQAEKQRLSFTLKVSGGIVIIVGLIVIGVLAILGGAEAALAGVVGTLGFLALLVWYYRRGMAALGDGRVASVHDSIRLEVSVRHAAGAKQAAGRRRTTTNYRLHAGGETFVISGERYSALNSLEIDGQTARVYYLPQSRQIIAIEAE
jgi:hypothetical protein